MPLCFSPRDQRIAAFLRRAYETEKAACGLTQEVLAAACGVTCQQIAKYLSGANRTTTSIFFILCQTLYLDPTAVERATRTEDERATRSPQEKNV